MRQNDQVLRDEIGSQPPGPDALAHSLRLIDAICAEIEANDGRLPFQRYMELALYAPGLGYYSAGARKFGPAGDFITAPELSSLFSRCLARQCQQVLAATGGDILELGAGSGIMAADILLELASLSCLPERYLILEVSAELRQRQRQTLQQHAPDLLPRVRWLDRLPAAPMEGVILANEVIDAMPVERFRVTPQGLRSLSVAWADSHFRICLDTPSATLTTWYEALTQVLGYTLPPGYESERNPHLAGWLQELANSLGRGVMLFIDYGYPVREYYHPERRMGTLVCHYRHRAHADPFVYPGLQDITANVDFSALAEAALAADLELLGYTSQNYFLFGCGLEKLLATADPTDSVSYLALTGAIKQLTLPGEMGERFKVLACGRGLTEPLCGFSFRDERFRL